MTNARPVTLLERYAKGRSVLNMFCYTGGFSVYAMRGDAKLLHSVDSLAKAIKLTNKNIELNFPVTPAMPPIQDAFKYLDRMGNQYNLIVLDPPAFAKHRDALRNALQGYRKLNVKAFEKVRPQPAASSSHSRVRKPSAKKTSAPPCSQPLPCPAAAYASCTN